tara:strand:- start:61 stop:1059 length:999 start_codon:yes stop_codon:yes gene_type:complete
MSVKNSYINTLIVAIAFSFLSYQVRLFFNSPNVLAQVNVPSKETIENYDTIFVGTSRVQHGINVNYYDSLNNNKTSSLNISTGALSFYEAREMINVLLQRNKKSLKIFLEPDFLMLHQIWLEKTYRATYFMSLSNMVSLIIDIVKGRYRLLLSKEQKTYSFVLNKLFSLWRKRFTNLGLFWHSIKEKNHPKRWENGNEGFSPLATEKNQKEKIKKQIKIISKNSPYNIQERHINMINELYEYAKNKGVELYILLPPSLIFSQNNHTAIVKHKKRGEINAPVIDFASYKLNSDLYKEKLYANVDHLNIEGSTYFTRKIASCIRNLESCKHVIH